ncbi:MAG: FAD-binding protein, partial [Desulfosarcina sp.]|nr:FAD-binding protein [Desulfosarcina sp.]MBC2767285.1 FAD-binding protein [Desulfosarcina sp.]
DFRAREANVYRLAQVSNDIIDQCVAQGIPFARDYGGLLDNRSFGGAQVSRTFYARGQTGQQLLLGAYSAMMRQVAAGKVQMFPRREMLDVVVVDGHAKGIVARNLISGEIERHAADAVVLCTGGYGNVFFLSTNAMASNVTAAYRAYKKGAFFANPCFTQIHPTCIPVHGTYQSKLTLMSESLRNDGRVWVPKNQGDNRKPDQIPESERDYFLERKYPSFGNLVPRDVASRNAKEQCDIGKGVVPGLFVLGEANFSDHGANRLGASALMQGLADGYFVLPYTIGGYLTGTPKADVTTGHKAFDESEKQVTDGINRMLAIDGKRTVDDFHKTLGHIMWDYCGMARTNEGLAMAQTMIQELRAEFWENVRVPGNTADFNQSLAPGF